jgi:GDP/UDP-N,N'-diacetylbacillosamine 2-epimerase (hydrolysing)
MRVAILTSSRADYGIYLPLLKKMRNDSFFSLHIIAFGTHLSNFHGHTIDNIIADGFEIDHTVEHILPEDSPQAISTSMANASLKFAAIWGKEKENYDLVFCLGDRYEMFAAVSAATPFNINFAHIHGGETTLGAIDNKFRHCLSIFSTMHFVSTENYAKRVAQLTGSESGIYNIGALSLDNLEELSLLTKHQFLEQYKINLDKPTMLVTFHPETVNIKSNEEYARQLVKALTHFTGYQLIITMPNADTMGNSMRKVYEEPAKSNPKVFLVENFGTLAYFSCMKWCKLVVGNSSSGIIEAASLKKYVVDVGERQKGRAISANVLHAEPNTDSVIEACQKAIDKGEYTGENIYYKKNAANSIIDILKKWKN